MNWLSIPFGFWIALTYSGVALTFVAGVLVARAVRGKPSGWQPTCRRCGHDLRGVDPDKAACPECGADLARQGAVLTGRPVRCRRSIAAAGIACVAAVAALWFLSSQRVFTMRSQLVSSMPVVHLVDVVIWGGADADDRETASFALWSQLGPRVGGSARTVPTGELLDAVLAAVARCEEPGRAPLTALLESYEVVTLLGELDDGEAARLVDLAVAEVIASKGAKMDLVRCAAVLEVDPAKGGLSPLAQIKEALRATPEGRAALEPQLIVTGTYAYGQEIDLSIRGPLDGVQQVRRPRSPDSIDALILEFAEATPEGAPADAVPMRLRESAGGDIWMRDGESAQPIVIADLPVGKHRLRVKGVIAPRTLLPARDPSRNLRGYGITLEDAARLEGARPFEKVVSIEIVPPAREVEPLERVVEPAAIEASIAWLKASRMQPSGFSRGLELEAMPDAGLESGRKLGYAFSMSVTQDGTSLPLGRASGSRTRRTVSDCRLPETIDPKRPFEITLVPDVTIDMADHVFTEPGGLALLWVRGTLRFPSASRPPEVAVEALPLEPVASSAVPRVEARELIERLAASMVAPGENVRAAARANRSRQASEFMVAFRVAPPAAAADETGSAHPTVLSGSFELLLDGRLAAPVQRADMSLDGTSRSIRIDLSPGLDPVAEYTLRYRPDPNVAAAKMPTSHRFIAEPFELRFTNGAKNPQVVWTNDAK